MNILQEICQFVINILNNPKILDKFLEGGAIISGDYFVWPLDGFIDEYGDFFYAINPYNGTVYELTSAESKPSSGILVSDPSLIKIIYDSMKNYLTGYDQSKKYFDGQDSDEDEVLWELEFTVPSTIIFGVESFHSLN